MALLHRVGWRGAALLFFALVGGVYSIALLTAPRPLPDSYAWADGVLPLWVWAVLWAAAGLACLVCAFARHDWPGFAAFAFMAAWWGLLSMAGWLWGDVSRGFLNAAIFLPLAGLMYVLAAGLKPKAGPR